MDKLDSEFNFGRQALDVRSYRQQLMSANIANSDTPGYKARDVDFSKSLTRALGPESARAPGTVWASDSIAGSGATLALAPSSGIGSSGNTGGLPMETTSPGHMAGLAGAAAAASAANPYGTPQYRNPYQGSMDGNTVELDNERVNFADNALHYETGLNVINQQIKTMLAAVSGNGGS